MFSFRKFPFLKRFSSFAEKNEILRFSRIYIAAIFKQIWSILTTDFLCILLSSRTALLDPEWKSRSFNTSMVRTFYLELKM